MRPRELWLSQGCCWVWKHVICSPIGVRTESGAGEEGESTSSSLRLDSSEGARAWKI